MSNVPDRESIVEQVSISSDLDLEFKRQSVFFATWACDHAQAQSEARRTEEAVNVIWARLQLSYRREHSKAKENEVKAYILRHKKYRQAVQAWNEAKFARDVFHAVVESFKQRKDMLVQLGADARAEMGSTDLHTKVKRANKIIRDTLDDKTSKAKSKKRKRSSD